MSRTAKSNAPWRGTRFLDLNTITDIVSPGARENIPPHAPHDAFLGGGTWLFSEPQTNLQRLIDLTQLGWDPLIVTPAGLQIAATCSIATLAAFEAPADWVAAPLILQCCRALLGSFKIWYMATVGGNLCMALPAGPMTALAVALDATCLIWTPDGGERVLPAQNFVLGPERNALAPGEILRRIDISIAALRARTAFRQISLSPQGRSGALLIGTLTPQEFTLTVTAATKHPIRINFGELPNEQNMRRLIDEQIPDRAYYDDVHGRPAWRRRMTTMLAEEIRRELSPP
jgi:CO/xanthine dehydrogenase FAD-binding subunit